ncbi:MAG: hypothetical protein ACK4RK_15840 [Gemmataceae bacterium]
MCKSCQQPFRPKSSDHHIGVYQPDMIVYCPECHKVLVCRGCGFVYGEVRDDEPM